jgi:hypothetical protein
LALACHEAADLAALRDSPRHLLDLGHAAAVRAHDELPAPSQSEARARCWSRARRRAGSMASAIAPGRRPASAARKADVVRALLATWPAGSRAVTPAPCARTVICVAVPHGRPAPVSASRSAAAS